MKEIRIHTRAGQGAITSAMLLAQAAFEEGKYALAFPSFGAARMGAPMNAFVRLDSQPIRIRSQIYAPDYIIVQDPTLLFGFNVLDGLKPAGVVVIDSDRKAAELKLNTTAKVITLPATEIAMEVTGRPLGNTVLLGAFAAITGEIGLEALQHSVRARFRGEAGEKNALAAQRGYEYVKGG